MITIEPYSRQKWYDLSELRQYRDLLFFLVWRSIQAIYAQTILGFSWAILTPLVQILLFTIVFGKVAKLDTDGIPYVLFSTVAIIPWTYISGSSMGASQSLVSGKHMLGKVYFPRYLFPLTPVIGKLLDFGISLIIIVAVCIYYKIAPTWNIIIFPFLVVYMMIISLGIGLWLSAMSIRFRDVRLAMPFALRMLMYTAPIVYSASAISEKSRLLYSINPIVGVIEGFRSCLLGTPILWNYIWPGLVLSLLILVTGAMYFKNMERVFVDVI
jgi:lipopolysaccharide transport system permease protein